MVITTGAYEKLLVELERANITVVEKHFKSSAKGLCKNNKIGIRKDICSTIEKACILAEELGHYHTSYGNILDQSDVKNRKQEHRARGWGYERMVPLTAILEAYWTGISSQYELAEFLDITEEFLTAAIDYYKSKHGLCYEMDHYLIYFDPLGVVEKFF